MNLVEQIKRRADSWYNAFTGLGNALRDKAESSYYQYIGHLSDGYLENLYHGDDLAARIIDALPEAALRNGYYLSAEDDDPDLASALHEYQKRLKFRTRLQEAAVWARLFGGAVVYLGIDDGQAEDQPINEAAIKTIRFATVLDKRSLIPCHYYETLELYGEPELYEVQRITQLTTHGVSGLATGVKIHESRLIRLDGARTTRTRREQRNGWSESCLEKVHNVIRDFGTSWQAVGHLMLDAGQGVFKVKGLMDMIAGGDKDVLATRMQLVDMSRSVARAILIDAEEEGFDRQAYSFQGIPDVLNLFMIRLAAAARMPVTVLMGQSPKGMNATGESDIRLWYDTVQTYQSDDLLPAVERFYHLVFLAQDFEGTEPESWEVKFGRLWQMSEQEQAELEKSVADKDKTYIDAQVLLPEEVATNRFKARGFSLDTQIDLNARKEMLEAELELAKDQAGELPPVPPVLPPGQPAPDDPKDTPKPPPKLPPKE